MTTSHESPLTRGLRAARATAPAGALLLSVALAILLGYHYVPPVTRALDRLAEIKTTAGLIFPIISTALFGAVIPICMQQALPSTREPGVWRRMPFLTLLWAFKGIEVDLLYRGEAYLIGDNAQPLTIITKVAFDQFVYCPLWAVPTVVLAYALPDVGYSLRRLRSNMGPQWYRRRVIPLLLANWFVWVPAVAVIYCLKQPLQLPIQNLVLCLWAILVMLLVHKPMQHPRDMLDAE
ncbi:hypothetical protein HED60_21050 [Planctomycetales bacterium ZRK34]|nr:hypothetical protein HED60_21050 [Planctomycetales bacterium ZRK34]